MGHPDEKALLHSLLLAAPLEHSLRMVVPVLHIFNATTGHFEETAAADLALCAGEALLTIRHSNYSGKSCHQSKL